MLRKKAYLKIFADKPDIFACLPPEVLGERAIEQLRQIPRLAVAEIAGPADVQALRELLPRCRPDGLLPTISYTATEFGDWGRLSLLAAELKKTLEKELNIYTAEPVVLGAPALWRLLLQAHEGGLATRFGFTSRCLGCRLYSFMLRVPLCKKIDARFFIPSHAGLVQRGCPAHCLPVEKKYFNFLMSGYGIEVWHQPQGLENPGAETACLACVLSGEQENSVSSDKLARYFETFALPAAGGILSLAVFGQPADYGLIISQTALPAAPAAQQKQRRRYGGPKHAG
jgi:hypothetical protein